MFNSLARLHDQFKYPRMTTIYPGSFTYTVAEFLLTHKLSSKPGSWFVNVSPLVECHGYKPVLRAIARLRSNYKMVIVKPHNKQFNRPNVWQLIKFEHIRFYKPEEIKW